MQIIFSTLFARCSSSVSFFLLLRFLTLFVVTHNMSTTSNSICKQSQKKLNCIILTFKCKLCELGGNYCFLFDGSMLFECFVRHVMRSEKCVASTTQVQKLSTLQPDRLMNYDRRWVRYDNAPAARAAHVRHVSCLFDLMKIVTVEKSVPPVSWLDVQRKGNR